LAIPLTQCQLQHLFYRIREMRISFSYRAVNVGLAVIPYFWDLEILLSLIGGKVQPRIFISHRIANVSGFSSGDYFSILNLGLLLLSTASFILSTRSSVETLQIFLRTKRRYSYYQRAARPGDFVSKSRSEIC
jgi:hypothetical protein